MMPLLTKFGAVGCLAWRVLVELRTRLSAADSQSTRPGTQEPFVSEREQPPLLGAAMQEQSASIRPWD